MSYSISCMTKDRHLDWTCPILSYTIIQKVFLFFRSLSLSFWSLFWAFLCFLGAHFTFKCSSASHWFCSAWHHPVGSSYWPQSDLGLPRMSPFPPCRCLTLVTALRIIPSPFTLYSKHQETQKLQNASNFLFRYLFIFFAKLLDPWALVGSYRLWVFEKCPSLSKKGRPSRPAGTVTFKPD